MRSRLIQGMAVTGALSLLSGCAFVAATDRAFLGSIGDPPTHANREWAGAVILPLAAVGDILTAPIQLVALLILGDGGLYGKPNGRAVVVTMQEGHGASVALVEPAMRRALLAGAEPSQAAGLRVWGVDANLHVVEIPLTSAQQAALAVRLDSAGSASVAKGGA